jgi:hypothetical protein
MNKKEMEELRCSTLGGMLEVISKAHLWQAYYDANESPYILREKAEDVKEAIEEVIERLYLYEENERLQKELEDNNGNSRIMQD